MGEEGAASNAPTAERVARRYQCSKPSSRPVVPSVERSEDACGQRASPAGAKSKPAKNAYVVHNLVADQSGRADQTDPNVVNAWGLAALPTGPWWLADNGTDTATVVDASGAPFPPPPATPLAVQVNSAPTGEVANAGSGFVVSNGVASDAAKSIFDTAEGKILGWSSTVSPTSAVLAAD